jgi:phosphopantothenoylcysteine decarboxylase/phosphopantothenate--cysteine ligase
LIAGPVGLTTPDGVTRVDVESAHDMLGAVQLAVPQADVFVACAAVADWTAAHHATQKMKKDGTGAPPALAFKETVDILATVAQSDRAQSGALYCVGFAAESHDLLANAQAKRAKKGVPLLVGNIGPDTFGRDHNALLLVTADGAQALPEAPKQVLAHALVAQIANAIGVL